MSKFLKIKDCKYLEKDPSSGAVLLSENQDVADIKLTNLMKRLGEVERQNKRIISLLEALSIHLGLPRDDQES